MFQQPVISFRGASGTSYAFTVYPWGQPFQLFGAVYTVLHRVPEGRYQLLYIGQTGEMSQRFDSHHKDNCFAGYGRTHIGVHPEPADQRRRAIETDLIRAIPTVCND